MTWCALSFLVAIDLVLAGCEQDGTAPPDAPTAESFRVVATDGGDRKIEAIKIVRQITGLGLQDAKDLVDNVPSVIRDGLSASESERLAQQLREAGMTVEVRPE